MASGGWAWKMGLSWKKIGKYPKEGNFTIAEVCQRCNKNEEINAAIAGARRNQWIQLVEGKMIPTLSSVKQSPEESFIENLKEGVEISKLTEEKSIIWATKKRPNYIEIKEEKESLISLTDAARTIIPTLNQEKLEPPYNRALLPQGNGRRPISVPLM